ncbi:MAG: hypothetical protein F4Z00_07190 [Acidimicrobiaceae bacterium]|nr:hypothetical protein [Acidimicrobiaceae bacterium]MYF34458.1 hypothetical protein [Acidimicrobiaceae bacterium]
MSLRACRHCGHKVHQQTTDCPTCGGPTPGLTTGERTYSGLLLAALLAVVIVPLAVLFYGCISAFAG